MALRSWICAVIIVAVGCGQGQTGPQKPKQIAPRTHTEEEANAHVNELLKSYPMPPPDTPEEIRKKEAKVEETLPKVYELLLAAEEDPKRVDEVVDLSMSLLTLVPNHRAAKVAYGKAQLASFFAKEVIDENGEMLDEHHMAVAIRSACLEIDRLRENHEDLSEAEVQLCQEVYFNRARMEGIYHYEPDEFIVTINKLMSTGFSDAERIKSEPRFKYFFKHPKTGPVLKAAVAKIEGSTEDDSSK